MLKYGLPAITAILVLLLFTKYVWQTGFDQGADAALCIVDYYRAGEDPNIVNETEACLRAKEGTKNPLWLLRRRGG